VRLVYAFQGRQSVLDTDRDEVVIGRPREGLIVHLDLTPDQQVSRPHARLSVEGGECWIEDLGSRRGTQIAGEEIRGRGKRRLRAGEVVKIGGTTLQLQGSATPDAAQAPATRDSESGRPAAPPVVPPAVPEEHPDTRITESVGAAVPARVALDTASDTSRRLAMLCELPLSFGAATRLDALLQTVVERLVEVVPGAARVALLVADPATGQLLLKAHLPAGRPAVSLTLAQRAVSQREGFVWRRGGDPSQSQLAGRIESGMYAPLVWKGEALGALSVVQREGGPAFTGQDLRLLIAVAHYAGMAVASHRLQEDLRSTAGVLGRLLTSFSPKLRQTLVERARHGRLRQGGQRSEVTILCSDIRGFTRLSAGMETDDVVDLLNDYFPALVEVVFRFDGTVDKFVGDGILAVFGSPEPDEQQHEHAVRAALAMQEAMRAKNAARAERGLATCQIGIGVHSGDVLHGFIGAAERMEFTVIGDAVNRAARYCDGAVGGEVLISPDVHQRVWRLVEAEPVSVATKHEGSLAAYRVARLSAVAPRTT